jgi:hypothetical protein
MKKILYLFIISIIISSCGNDKNVYLNDFDQLGDWGCGSSMLKTGDAHSGMYYCGLDSTNEYSLTFVRQLKNIDVQNISSINLSAWVRTKTVPSKAVLVVTIDSTGGPVKYMGIALKDEVFNPSEWTEIKQRFDDIPSGLNPNDVLKVYLLNSGKESVDIDDIRFKVE